jgi:hypothetical protein
MAFSKEKRQGRLFVYDSMAAPGQPVSLLADLVEEGMLTLRPLGGEVISFQVGGRSMGTALTGGDGRAVKPFVPAGVGVLDLAVRLDHSPRIEASEARARVFVWDRRRPLLLIAHAALIARPRGPAVGLPVPDFGGPLPGPEGHAVEALSALSRRAHLLYVSSADRAQVADLRKWMEQHRVPAGPFFSVKAKPPALAQQVEAWRQAGWRNIKGGLAATPEEAGALIGSGLKAVSPPGASSKEKWPEKTIMTKDWTDVVTQLSR